jgi:hypothetical protein
VKERAVDYSRNLIDELLPWNIDHSTDLLPSFRTKLSMISAKERGRVTNHNKSLPIHDGVGMANRTTFEWACAISSVTTSP